MVYDFGSERGDNVLPCSQNAPTFVASSLLPKPQGQEDTWGQADAQTIFFKKYYVKDNLTLPREADPSLFG